MRLLHTSQLFNSDLCINEKFSLLRGDSNKYDCKFARPLSFNIIFFLLTASSSQFSQQNSEVYTSMLSLTQQPNIELVDAE